MSGPTFSSQLRSRFVQRPATPSTRPNPDSCRPKGVSLRSSASASVEEPSLDPARMQVFRQHEFVYIGDPEGARLHRDRWVERGLEIHSRLGLPIEAVVANDPFFGRSGKLLAANQISEALKVELVSPICSLEEPTAITSANCHLDHFGAEFGIETVDGRRHTAPASGLASSASPWHCSKRMASIWRHGQPR